jgi:hypothetical protein
MRLAIVGSRGFNNSVYAFEVLDQVLSDAGHIECVISGGARGADTVGVNWATAHGIPHMIHLPKWDIYGKRAGFIRNCDIIRDCDTLIAFWDGKSSGTRHSTDLAKSMGKTVIIKSTNDSNI